MTRLAKVLRGFGALVLLAALILGVPYALCHFVGWPLPHRLPSWSGLGHDLNERGIPDRTLIDALAVAVWLCWAVLVASLVAEVPAAIRGQRARRLPLAGAFQPLTGHLLAALVVAMLALSPRPTQAGASTLGTRPVATVVLTDATGHGQTPPPRAVPFQRVTTATTGNVGDETVSDERASPPMTATRNDERNRVERTYVVRHGDTLWGIAKRELGDPLRWSDIYQLNAGRPQPGGQVLSNPHWIDPGWTLILPSSPTGAPIRDTTPQPTSAPSASPITSPVTSAPPTTTPPTPSSTIPTTVPPPTVGRPAPARGAILSVSDHANRRGDATPAPVRLPSGSIVGGSFAIGILAALALARLRRRHAYRYRPPAPGRGFGRDPLRPTLRAIATAVQSPELADDDLYGEDDEEIPEPAPVVILPAMADEDPDHRERPDLIEVGTRRDKPVTLSLGDFTGVVLDGPDADGVARAWLTALLVRAGPVGAALVTTEAVLERIVPAETLGLTRDVPGLRIVADEDAVLRNLEAEALARVRQLDAADTPDVLSYRRANPWEPVPAVVALLGQFPSDDAGRWAAVVSAGSRLGLGAVALGGDSPNEVRLGFDADHVVTTAQPDELASRLFGARLFAMGPDEGADVFATLGDVEERPSSEGLPDEMDDDAVADPWPAPVSLSVALASEPIAEEPRVEVDEPQPAVAVRLFGSYEVRVNGELVAKGLRTPAKELLVWYLLRPEGTTIEVAVDNLWPDTQPGRVHRDFWTAGSNLRTRLGAKSNPAAKLLVQVGDVYLLDPAAISSDLWQFQAALTEAAHATDDGTARVALRRAVALCRGDLAENAVYRWIEPVRHDLHRRALDAHLRLAELEERLDAPDAAVEVLEHAIELDRYAEEPYRRLMILAGARGRLDTVTATWRLLEERLREIDVDPEPATVRLHRSLTAPPASDPRVHPIRLSS